MLDNALILLVLAVIIALALFVVISKFMQAKKENPSDTLSETLQHITGVLREQAIVAFQMALELREADKGGFEAVRDFVLDNIMEYLSNNQALSASEKALLDRTVISNLITPYLKALWDYKLEMPDKNMTKATLRLLRAEAEQEKQNG
jgi:hypothetical protein